MGRASPSNSLSTPAMMRSRVDLPAPLRPSTPILAPGKNDREMSLRICRLGAIPFPPDACCIRIGPCGNNLDYEIEGVAPRTGAEWWARLAEVGGEGKCGTMNPTIRPPESFSCASL